MLIYPADYDVSVTVPFVDLNGAPVTLSALRAALYDGDDQLIVNFGSLAYVQGEGSKTILVDSAYNELTTGELRVARVLRIELETTAGIVRRSFTYLIASELRLELMANSFLTLASAELLASDQVNLSGWLSAGEDARYAALIQAFRKLTGIPMRFFTRAEDGRTVLAETIILRHNWAEITAEQFLAFPRDFKMALRNAQLAEANELLQGDVISAKRRAGVISETIGESSVTLATGKIEYGVSSQAMGFINSFIYYNIRIARS